MILKTALIVVASLALIGCSESASEQPADNNSSGSNNGASAPAWMLASAPADVRSVADAKENAKEGDTVVIRGIIGGDINAITTDSPIFRIIDTGVVNPCTSKGDDHCPTPWDYCCTPVEERNAMSATIQLVDANGAPIETDLMAAGLQPLDEVVVVGIVAPRPDPVVLTIRATGVYRNEG